MILQAGYDCYLTQSAEVPLSERRFENNVFVSSYEEVLQWREITSREKEQLIATASFVDVTSINVEALDKVNMLMKGIKDNINGAGLTSSEALSNKEYFPEWKDMIGAEIKAGFRVLHNGVLYEVVQNHLAQVDWEPGTGTESLYKVVQAEYVGTLDSPIPWVHNMVLEKGKYYTDKEILYLCIRDGEISMSFDLADLLSSGYVQVINEKHND